MKQEDARELKANLEYELLSMQQVVAGLEPPASLALATASFLLNADLTHGSGHEPAGESLFSELVLAFPALGISRRAEEYLLAVRVQTELEDVVQPFLDYVSQRAGGQLDVRNVVGARVHSGAAGSRQRPVAAGVSIGRADGITGTLGCFVTRNGGPAEGLSMNHVLANANRGTLGDDILQPGTEDGGAAPGDRIGELIHFHPLVRPPQANIVDAALCRFDDAISTSPPIPPLTMFEADTGDAVEKCGRTTGRTEGEVTVTELDGMVLDVPGFGPAIFDGLFEVESSIEGIFSDVGDSGALVTDRSGSRAAGLLLGGLDAVSWVIPLSTTLQALGVALVR